MPDIPASPRSRGGPHLDATPCAEAGTCHEPGAEETPMSQPYRIYGMELSPYSVKVRSYFYYKGIPSQWLLRTVDRQAEFQQYAKLPLVPLVVTPEGEGMQDSTPIIEKMEELFPEPSIHPADPVLRFLSALLEEFGDEWGNKWMFHYRWAREVDQRSGAERLVRDAVPTLEGDALTAAADAMRERMVGRVWFVGSSPETAPQIEDSYRETLDLLEAHLAGRRYLFGGRPVFADFGLWGQLYEASTDPTPGALLRERACAVVSWVARMLTPQAESEVETWEALAPTLRPLLERQVGRLFLPWSDANAKAIAAGSETFSVELGGRTWTQKPQKYHARSLAALRARYAAVGGNAELDRILEETGCRRWLRG
jgi:glutathione S-transferase